jgi:hypothetical protein
MAQAPPHGSSLTVLGGPKDGVSFPLGTAFEELLIGSDPSCEIAIDLPDVSPVHAKLLVEAAGVTVSDTHSPFGLFVNDDRVTAPTRLRDGDVIWLGAPGDPSSVMLLCHIVAVDVPVVAPLPGGGAPPMEIWDSAPAERDAGEAFFVDPAAAAPAAPEVAFEAAPEPQPPPADTAAFFVEREAAEPETPAPAESAPAEDVFFVGDAAPPAPAAPAAVEPPSLDLAFTETPPATGAEPVEPFVLDLGFGDAPAPRGAASPTGRLEAGAPTRTAEPEEPPDFFVDIEPSPAPAPPAGRATAAPRAPAAAPPAPAAPVTLPAMPVATPRAAAPPVAGTAPAQATAPASPKGAPAPVVVPRRPRVGAPPPQPAGAPPRLDTPPAPAAPGGERAGATPLPTPTARSVPPARPAPATPPSPVARRPVAPPVRPRPAARRAGSGGRTLLVAAALAVVLIAGGWFGWSAWSTPRLDAVSPPRAHSGQVVTLSGARFAAGARVLFGAQPGRVVKLEAGRIEVEVPELSLAPGPDRPVAVVVHNGARASVAVMLLAFIAPRLHGIAPDVALAGEEVELVGTGWGPGAAVHFGALPAEVLSVGADTVSVRVPAIEGPPGTAAPVTVTMGSATSNAAPFFVGRVPLVIGVQPAQGAPGDVLTVTGRGFRTAPGATRVTLGGRPALVLSANDGVLSVVAPWGVPAGASALEVRVSGLEPVGLGSVSSAAPAPNVDFRFVAEPLEEAPDGALAAVATELGPAFVLAAAGGRTAAQRALEAQNRLNQAAVALKASLSAELEVRFGDPPSLGLRGRPEALLSATPEDAAAYAQAGRRAVSPARLAAWWTALARDLVLLLVRSERPRHAAELAGEGRALGDAFQAGRRAAPFGLPRAVAGAQPLRAALRGLALRVPASVPEPALVSPAAPARAGTAPLRLDGAWGGRERVPEGRRFIGVTFEGRGGTFALESGLTLSLPLLGLERPHGDGVRFSVRLGGGVRYYTGRWDGAAIRGSVSADAAGRDVLGTFELAPR